mgnify:FL=1
MNTKNKDFYVWTMSECIKSTYEWWGIDMMSMYNHIKKDFPNASVAIKKMYQNFDKSNFNEAEYISYKIPKYVYEAISNLIPLYKELHFDIRTKELNRKYKWLNMCSWNQFVSIKRIDLLMAVILFTEEFIFDPITSKNVILTDTKLTVYGNFVTFKVSKHKKKTYISIKIRGIMLLEYVILN